MVIERRRAVVLFAGGLIASITLVALTIALDWSNSTLVLLGSGFAVVLAMLFVRYVLVEPEPEVDSELVSQDSPRRPR